MVEASADGTFANGKIDPAEAGRRGAQAREANWHARITAHREELEKLAPKATRTIEEILDGERRPNVLPAANAVLDRIGLGPSSKTEVAVGPNEHLAQLIERLDAEEARSKTVVAIDVPVSEGAPDEPLPGSPGFPADGSSPPMRQEVTDQDRDN